MKKIIILLTLLIVASASMCVNNEEINEHSEDVDIPDEIIVEDVPVECPNMEAVAEYMTELYDNPYNKGTTYVALTLPEEFVESYSIVDGYNIEYPYGRRIFCLKTSAVDSTYEFKCLDWNINSIEEETVLKKMNVFLSIDLEFDGFKNSITEIRYLSADCRDA